MLTQSELYSILSYIDDNKTFLKIEVSLRQITTFLCSRIYDKWLVDKIVIDVLKNFIPNLEANAVIRFDNLRIIYFNKLTEEDIKILYQLYFFLNDFKSL